MVKNICLDRSEGKSVDQQASINPQDLHVFCTPAISIYIIMKLTLTQ